MDKINKLSLPITILLASVILGGFYYATELNKQSSIERQQQLELEAKQMEAQTRAEQERTVSNQKTYCVYEAQQNAINLNKDSCARGDYCIQGERMYLVGQYDTAYKTCLQAHGIE